MCCLLDTGSHVSTLTESCYKPYFNDIPLTGVSQLMQLSDSQGLAVPVIGYVPLGVAVLGKVLAEIGFCLITSPRLCLLQIETIGDQFWLCLSKTRLLMNSGTPVKNRFAAKILCSFQLVP